MSIILKSHASTVADVLIKDVGIKVPQAGGQTEDFTSNRALLNTLSNSANLLTLLTDDAFGAGESTLILNDGTDDIEQAKCVNYLPNIILAAGAGVLNDYGATTAPGAAQDRPAGFSVGSRCIITALVDKPSYVSVDDTDEAAVWRRELFSQHSRLQLFADQLDSPNSSDWKVNANAPADADTNNAGLTVRRFNDTIEEGVGFTLFVPAGVKKVSFDICSRAETADAAGAKTVGNKLYFREIPDQGVASATWAGTNDGSYVLADIDIPNNTEDWQHDSQEVSLATLGMVAGTYYQCEFTRVAPGAGVNLVNDWSLLSLVLETS